MAKFTFVIYSQYVGADIEEEFDIPDEVLAPLSEDEKNDYLDAEAKKWMLQNVEWGWKEVEE